MLTVVRTYVMVLNDYIHNKLVNRYSATVSSFFTSIL